MQNQSDVDTDVMLRLKEKLHAWRKDVGAQEAVPNDSYEPERTWEGFRKGTRKK